MIRIAAVFFVLCLGSLCIAETDRYKSEAMEFVKARLADSDTFVVNPPSEINPYRHTSNEQIKVLTESKSRSGSSLYLYLNGMPSWFVTYNNRKEDGLQKGWYKSGIVQFEEYYDTGKLVSGVYYDESGLKLGEVIDGAGVRYVFRPVFDEGDGRPYSFVEYKDGEASGKSTRYPKKVENGESEKEAESSMVGTLNEKLIILEDSVAADVISCWERSVYEPVERKVRWALCGEPRVLLKTDSKRDGMVWEAVRKDFDYRPCGMVVWPSGEIVVWGTEEGQDVRGGIPYRVEVSYDDGETWSDLKIPDVDYLVGIDLRDRSFSEGDSGCVMNISGVRIPEDGLPDGMDWYDVNPVTIESKDMKTFIELVGMAASEFVVRKVETKEAAPDGICKAFVVGLYTLQEPRFELNIIMAEDMLPETVGAIPSDCEIVWSVDSKFLAVRKDGRYVGCYDFERGEFESVLTYIGTIIDGRDKAKDQIRIDEFDSKTKELLGGTSRVDR